MSFQGYFQNLSLLLPAEQKTNRLTEMNRLLSLLKQFFGYTSFRPLQADIIKHILEKKDALVLMPTGGGKSICFQLPAIYLPGVTIVVSPLIALMKDQVEGLVNNGIPAASLNSMMPEAEQQRVKQLARQGRLKLLYISPERVKAEADWFLPSLNVSLIAIDEAHCVSHWGHDFRPEYTQLAILKERFPNVPVVALTATADKVTRTDIIKQLNLHEPGIFISSFDRPNLSLTVEKGLNKKEKIQAIVRFIRRHSKQSGIVYCQKRSDTEMLSDELSMYNIDAIPYHAGLPHDVREQAQNDFISDRVNVICATVAFGMGIDKSNVRWVIHYNMPGSIENYYQEIGRAGRDGAPADTLLFYSVGDLILLRQFVEESGQKEINSDKLEWMRRYCEADVCRRRVLLSYFGEESKEDCGNCDVCKNPPVRFDGSILVQKALSGMIRTGEQVGMNMLIDILRGSSRAEIISKGYNMLKTYGAGRDLPFKVWKEYIYQMIQLGYIEINPMSNYTLKSTESGRNVLFGKETAQLARYRERVVESSQSSSGYKATPIRPKQSVPVDESLLDALMQLRKQLAEREHKLAYHIFSDDSLYEMVAHKPVTLAEFGMIRGVGDIKLERYGRIFVSLIRFVLKMPKLPQ